jgi:hypothetical protein
VCIARSFADRNQSTRQGRDGGQPRQLAQDVASDFDGVHGQWPKISPVAEVSPEEPLGVPALVEAGTWALICFWPPHHRAAGLEDTPVSESLQSNCQVNIRQVLSHQGVKSPHRHQGRTAIEGGAKSWSVDFSAVGRDLQRTLTGTRGTSPASPVVSHASRDRLAAPLLGHD